MKKRIHDAVKLAVCSQNKTSITSLQSSKLIHLGVAGVNDALEVHWTEKDGQSKVHPHGCDTLTNTNMTV